MVIASIKHLPDKSSTRDPIPISLLKRCVYILAPFITHIFNTSLTSGVFPTSWKCASITSFPKKSNCDSLDVTSYRAISNLPVLSKVLERFVTSQIRLHLSTHDLLPCCQSAYRPNHSTETAILKLSSDILPSLDRGDLCLMGLIIIIIFISLPYNDKSVSAVTQSCEEDRITRHGQSIDPCLSTPEILLHNEHRGLMVALFSFAPHSVSAPESDLVSAYQHELRRSPRFSFGATPLRTLHH